MMADDNSSLPLKSALETESDTKKDITESATKVPITVGDLIRAMTQRWATPSADTFRDEAKQASIKFVDENQLSLSDLSSLLPFSNESKVRLF